MRYPHFTIDIKADGENILEQGMFSFRSITLFENINEFPKVILNLEGLDYTSLVKKKEFEISIKSEVRLNKFNLAVEYHREVGLLYTNGWACKYDDAVPLASEYLGSSLPKAIKALNIRPAIKNVDAISGEFFRFNETKIECLVRLLKGAKADSIFSIGPESIEVIDLLDRNSPKGYHPPRDIVEIKVNNRYKVSNVLKEFKKTFYNLVFEQESVLGKNNAEYSKNYISNLKYKLPPSFMMVGSYSSEFPLMIGDLMKMDQLNYPISAARVIGRRIEYSEKEIISKILFGGNFD